MPNITGWDSDNVENDVSVNACVIWDTKKDAHIVIVTTDVNATAKEIVITYEMRPEIEEDFRQLKDFWKIEDFKTTEYNVIAFRIICVLFGYLFYQLYINSESGSAYLGQSLPVILKNYKEKTLGYFILYGRCYFCCMSMKEFFEFRDGCSQEIKEYLVDFLAD